MEPKRKNINDNKTEEKQCWVRRAIDGTVVGFENWIQDKIDTLEFTLQLSSGGCKEHNARAIQYKLEEQPEHCPFVRIRPKTWER
jgi:hypothetical protein